METYVFSFELDTGVTYFNKVAIFKANNKVEAICFFWDNMNSLLKHNETVKILNILTISLESDSNDFFVFPC